MFAFSQKTQSLSLGHACGNFDLMRFGFNRASDIVAHADFAHGTARGFFKRDHDVALDVVAALGELLFAQIRATAKAAARTAPRAAEHLLEEIAEARAVEFKFLRTGVAAAKCLAAPEVFRARRRPEFRAGLPVRAEFVVFFALVRVGQDFVSLVDFLEFFLGLFFVLGDVGMIEAREFAEGFFYLVGSRGARDAEAFVIIFVLDGHGFR